MAFLTLLSTKELLICSDLYLRSTHIETVLLIWIYIILTWEFDLHIIIHRLLNYKPQMYTIHTHRIVVWKIVLTFFLLQIIKENTLLSFLNKCHLLFISKIKRAIIEFLAWNLFLKKISCKNLKFYLVFVAVQKMTILQASYDLTK